MSLLLLSNTTNDLLLKHCSLNMCVGLKYGIYFTENCRFYVKIEENEVYVGQDSPETENRRYRLFLFNNVSVADVQSNRW